MSAPPPPAIVAPPPPISDADDKSSSGIVVTGSSVRSLNRASDTRISVDSWLPDRDYLKAFEAAPNDFAALFAEWEARAGGVPAFYLDTADWLERRGRRADAIETLMSALDLPVADQRTLAMVAARLERYGELDTAIALRDRHAALDPERPQPRRLLALALAKRAQLGARTARADLQRAIGLLTDIALSPVAQNWDGIDMVALTEANALLVHLRALGGNVAIDKRLVRNLHSDIRVVVDWTTDATDLDLWVDEPGGDRASYDNQRTEIGGHMSDDMTAGYGPEEYWIRRAQPGRYTISANVFSSDRLDPNGAARLTARLIRNWGRPNEREEAIDIELSNTGNDERKIGTISIGRAGPTAK